MKNTESWVMAASIVGSLFGCEPARPVEPAPAAAREVVAFWRKAGPDKWFAKDPTFDRSFRDRFAGAYESAVRGELAAWQGSAEGALGLVILLDQYPRNAFRGGPRMYASDAQAREVSARAIQAGLDLSLEARLRLFLYLPYGHSEDPIDQERSVELSRTLSPVDVAHAEHHRDIIRRFGRFPHRNAILGRVSNPDEVRYLASGGFQG